MPDVSHSATSRRAMGEGCSTKVATLSMLLPTNFQATAVRMPVISTILATLAICCLENKLAKPEMGLRRLNWGVMGLPLKIQPPAPMALIKAAPPVKAANKALADPAQAVLDLLFVLDVAGVGVLGHSCFLSGRV